MKALIAYYSRTGVTRAAGQAIAAALKEIGDVEVATEEVVETKSRAGVMGWLSAGKDALMKKPAVISRPATNPGDFDVVVIGSPVWAFKLATPMQTYCDAYGRYAKAFAVFCTMGGSGDKKTFANAERIIGRPAVATLSLIDKRVKTGDQQEFLDKVKAFAHAIVASQAQASAETA